MMALLLEASDVRVNYGRVEALHGVSLRVAEGQIATIIGANGAGKTTLLSALMGLLPYTGQIAFPQHSGALRSTEARVRSGICMVPETRDLFGTMSVDDNLLLGAFVRRGDRDYDLNAAFKNVFSIFPRLQERRAQLANTLSGGERQMLALGRALMTKPALLMLDEPSLGLSPMLAKEIISVVAGLRDQGLAVLLVEQNARAALGIADHAYVLETGNLILEGPAATVAHDPKVLESYLGIRA
jgi:branched-chain amino acid transport system ATP-binding protein